MMLRKFLSVMPNYPQISTVKVIFTPGRYDCYSFITEAGYRVNVYDTSPFFSELRQDLEDWVYQDICLGIRVDDPGKASWTLVEVPSTKASWISMPWGWKLGETYSTASAGRKPGSPSQAKSRKSGEEPPAENPLRGA